MKRPVRSKLLPIEILRGRDLTQATDAAILACLLRIEAEVRQLLAAVRELKKMVEREE